MLLRFQGAPILTLTRLFRLCFGQTQTFIKKCERGERRIDVIELMMLFNEFQFRGTVCRVLPPEPFGSTCVDRGYGRRSAGCPDHGQPLVKPIIARAGDFVQVTSHGIRVNGSLVPRTQARPEDSAGRPLSSWPLGLYCVTLGSI